MKCFGLLKHYLTLIGIIKSDKPHGKLYAISLNCAFLGAFVNIFLPAFWFFFFDAKTFIEYAKSIFFISTSVLVISWYLFYLWQRKQYTELLDGLDVIIEQIK